MMCKAVCAALLAVLGICAAGNDMRTINARDLVGTFTLSSLGGCPNKMYYAGLVSGGNAIAHADVKMNEIRCEANGEMDLIAMAKEGKVNKVVNRLKAETRELAVKVLTAIPRGSYVGVSSNPLKCGPVTFDDGTLFIFAKSNEIIDFNDPLIEPMPAYQRILIVVQPRINYMCTYTAKLRESPSPTPSNSPSPTSSKIPAISPSKDDSEVQQSAGEVGVSEVPSPSPELRGAVCFPSDAEVKLRGGSTKMMSELVVGDEVAVGDSKYSPIFMFTHKLRDTSYTFVVLTTTSGHSITLTPDHYIMLDDGSLRAASSVRVGNMLKLHDGNSSAVTHIGKVRSNGLYNPQTADGRIVVGGIVASTYTKTVAPEIAHPLLTPLRAAWNMFGFVIRAFEGGSEKVAALMPEGSNAI